MLIVAIALGMLTRLSRKRERVTLPPLSGWVLAFVAVVLVEALNPSTGGVLKAVGGYRQQLEFVPLFFFGYVIVRSKRRFRQLFLLLGVIALANGVVGAPSVAAEPGAAGRLGVAATPSAIRGSRGDWADLRQSKASRIRAHPPWARTPDSAAASACSRCPA